MTPVRDGATAVMTGFIVTQYEALHAVQTQLRKP